MEYEPTEIDTTGEPRAFGFKDIGASANGRWARIVFMGRDLKTEIPIQLAADLLDKMLPSLMKVAAECERRRDGTNPKRAYNIKQGEVGVTTNGGIVFEFTTPVGQNFAFEMDRIGAQLILESLSKILEWKKDQNTPAPDRPQSH
jgi:hypothetical protein